MEVYIQKYERSMMHCVIAWLYDWTDEVAARGAGFSEAVADMCQDMTRILSFPTGILAR